MHITNLFEDILPSNSRKHSSTKAYCAQDSVQSFFRIKEGCSDARHRGNVDEKLKRGKYWRTMVNVEKETSEFRIPRINAITLRINSCRCCPQTICKKLTCKEKRKKLTLFLMRLAANILCSLYPSCLLESRKCTPLPSPFPSQSRNNRYFG